MIDPAQMTAFASSALGLRPEAKIEWMRLSERGSDRTYFRLKWNGSRSALLMHYDPERRENMHFAGIASFLESIHLPVPRILEHDPRICCIVLEDLGDIDLWSMRLAPWDTRKDLYQRTLLAIRGLHAYAPELFPHDRATLADPFGPQLYRWERDYFKDNFVVRFCKIGLEPRQERQLETELDALAGRLGELPQSLIHRDLQSQNVMLYEERPFFIDFQGMRFGTLFYDLGSLLYDPYVRFEEWEREDLLFYYFRNCKTEMEWDAFRTAFLEASAQRLMQALGAYAFLGIAKGLEQYLTHVPFGLANLQETAEKAGTLPKLGELALRCGEALSR